ncbi:MAG: hydrolase 2, exosortase A system-associated [Rhodoferax sp.]|nr:hydrolase 2, exosortase A system-associated [Rhodoferax sp.]
MPVEAFFLPVTQGQRFCLFHPAKTSTLRGLVLYVHPFAEEMNKSRHMAAVQSRALAHAGYGVLQVDLMGCGDSCGDFGDARWKIWVDDVVQAALWLRGRGSSHGASPASAPLWLWGLRAGCLLGVQAAPRIDEPCNFLFWQPPMSGSTLLQQFLRLKLASDLLGGRQSGAMGGLRKALESGAAVEIAGYTLAPDLALGLQGARLAPPVASSVPRQVQWFEVSDLEPPCLHPLATDALMAWQQSGYRLERHAIAGPSFWQTSEICDIPGLIAATTAAFSPRAGT